MDGVPHLTYIYNVHNFKAADVWNSMLYHPDNGRNQFRSQVIWYQAEKAYVIQKGLFTGYFLAYFFVSESTAWLKIAALRIVLKIFYPDE